MREAFEWPIICYAPDQPDKEIAAILSFDPSKAIRLNIIRKSIQGNQFSVLLGTNYKDEPITLLNVAPLVPRLSNLKHITLYPETLIVGSHLNEFNFSNFLLQLPFMHEWIQLSYHTGEQIEYTNGVKSIKVEFTHEPDIEIKIDEKLTLIFQQHLHQRRHIDDGYQMSSTLTVKCQFSSPISLEDFGHYTLQDTMYFFMFVMDRPLHIESLKLNNPHYEVDKSHIWEKEVSVYFPSQTFQYEHLQRNTLFTYEDIAHTSNNVIQNWIELRSKIGDLIDLFIRAFYLTESTITFQFLSLCQIFEAYETIVYGGQYQTKEEFNAVFERLKSALEAENLDSEHYERIIGTLHFGNLYSFRTKLRLLLTREDILGGVEDEVRGITGQSINDFTKEIVDSRNYYTHYTESLKRKAAGGNELNLLVKQMKKLFQLCLLVKLGFEKDKIKQLIERNAYFWS